MHRALPVDQRPRYIISNFQFNLSETSLIISWHPAQQKEAWYKTRIDVCVCMCVSACPHTCLVEAMDVSDNEERERERDNEKTKQKLQAYVPLGLWLLTCMPGALTQ